MKQDRSFSQMPDRNLQQIKQGTEYYDKALELKEKINSMPSKWLAGPKCIALGPVRLLKSLLIYPVSAELFLCNFVARAVEI